MRLYRVTWVDPGRWQRLKQRDPGHPLHVPLDLQGAGRFDNPEHYAALYTATEPAAAIGETFGSRHTWAPSMFTRPKDRLVRALVTLEDDPQLIDLDDAATLQRLRLRPSDVVRRNQNRTREIALRLWLEDHDRVTGLAWWSYHRPEWRLVMLWSTDFKESRWFRDVRATAVEVLDFRHPAVQLAATVLPRRLHR